MSISREVIAVNANLVIMEITAKQVRDNFPSCAYTIPLLNYIFPLMSCQSMFGIRMLYGKGHLRVPKPLTFKPTG